MASVLGRARFHILTIPKASSSPFSFMHRNKLQQVNNALILSASSSSVSERIERKRKEAFDGGGPKRIDRQHKRVRKGS